MTDTTDTVIYTIDTPPDTITAELRGVGDSVPIELIGRVPGWAWYIKLLESEPPPEEGCTFEPRKVRVSLTARVAAYDGAVRAEHLHDGRVLGEPVNRKWGDYWKGTCSRHVIFWQPTLSAAVRAAMAELVASHAACEAHATARAMAIAAENARYAAALKL